MSKTGRTATSYSPQGLLEAYETPVDVVVTKGHYGAKDAESLSEGENMYVISDRCCLYAVLMASLHGLGSSCRRTILFARQEEVIIAEDRHHREILVPLTSSAQFKILDMMPRVVEGKQASPHDKLRTYNVSALLELFKLPLQVTVVGDDVNIGSGSRRFCSLVSVWKLKTVF